MLLSSPSFAYTPPFIAVLLTFPASPRTLSLLLFFLFPNFWCSSSAVFSTFPPSLILCRSSTHLHNHYYHHDNSVFFSLFFHILFKYSRAARFVSFPFNLLPHVFFIFFHTHLLPSPSFISSDVRKENNETLLSFSPVTFPTLLPPSFTALFCSLNFRPSSVHSLFFHLFLKCFTPFLSSVSIPI